MELLGLHGRSSPHLVTVAVEDYVIERVSVVRDQHTLIIDVAVKLYFIRIDLVHWGCDKLALISNDSLAWRDSCGCQLGMNLWLLSLLQDGRRRAVA